jgi:hypothetical protein
MKVRTSVLVAAAASVLGVSAFAVPALAGPHSATVHTIRFTGTTLRQHAFGSSGRVTVDTDVQDHKVFTYDIATATGTNTVDMAIALNDGFLYAHIVFGQHGDLTGTVTGGSGKFAGVTGTISGKPGPTSAQSAVTVRYHR